MPEKIKIWGEKIPYNSTRSKLEDMVIKPSHIKFLRWARFFMSLPGKKFKDRQAEIDTFTYHAEIKSGCEKETYEDEPYIVPYIVKGSDSAVIVVPGGGFAYKSADYDNLGNQGEGNLMAEELNKAGISAFVLLYRTNPYRMPVPLLDMQRAVRFVRYHAADYGINPNKIGAVGFSAGGYEIAGLINRRCKDALPETYTPDEVDAVSDALQAAGLIYPCLGFQYLQPMMPACFSAGQLDTEEKRAALIKQYDCIGNFCSADTPQFLSYGGSDILIPEKQQKEYTDKLKSSGASYEVLVIPGANHGYGATLSSRKKYGYWIDAFIEWCKKQFAKADSEK